METLPQSHLEHKGKNDKAAADQVPNASHSANESAQELSSRQKRRLAQREKKKEPSKEVSLKPSAEAAKQKGGKNTKGIGKGKDKKGKCYTDGRGGAYRPLPVHLQSQSRPAPKNYQYWKGSHGGNRSGSKRWGKPPWS